MCKIQVVVLGRNYSSLLGMIRAVGYAGYEVTVINTVKKINNNFNIKNLARRIIFGRPIESSSKFVKKTLYAIEPDRENLIQVLLNEFATIKNKVILLPTDDFTASTIDLYQDKLKEKFLFPNILNCSGKIVELMNKDIQKNLADKSGLKVAKGQVINISNNKYKLPDNIIYPVFTKPQISFKGNKTFMRRFDNEKDLTEFVDKISKKFDCSILLEQYINIEKEYAILGCCYNNNVIMPVIIEMLRGGSGEHRGVTLMGKVLPFDKCRELYQSVEKFMCSINFNGLFDIDLYESNGEFYFNELNLRFGASGYAITKSGINLPEIFINKLLNKTVSKDLNFKIEDKCFVNEKVNLEEYSNGYIDWKEYKKINKSVDFTFIKENNDLRPYKWFRRKEIYEHMKKILKRGK